MNSFDSIIGYEGVKKELYQVIDIFKNKQKYEDMGAKIPRGVLIYGRPGLGKTMLSEALINECGVDAFVIKNNNSEKELINDINDKFSKATELDKAIIFLDDLDKFSDSDEDSVDDRIFVTIQANIDSVKGKDILVIATVNSLRKLPHSLVRSGRFDRKLGLDSPSNEDARKIIEYYLSTKKINPNLNIDDVSKMINYTSCAELETILNESAIIAAYNNKDSIDIDDIAKAHIKDEYDIGDDKFECSDETAMETALHEAGHAVAAEAIKDGCVGFLTIQATDTEEMQGFTHICERFNRRPENVVVALAGKAACELFIRGRCASGCMKDLTKAVELIKDGLEQNGTYGLSFLKINDEPIDLTASKRAAIIQAELERFMFIAKDILLKNKDFLFKLAEELKEKKVIFHSDIKRIKETVNVIHTTV